VKQQKPVASHPADPHAESFDPQPILDLIAGIQADLDRLKGLVEQAAPKYDPANPANKMADGKLSKDGVECCYRMFDEGASRYSVARAMKISFAAATHRFNAWRNAGGEKRVRSLMG
jgi:hypothetical protein